MCYNIFFMPSKFEKNLIWLAWVMAIFVSGMKRKLHNRRWRKIRRNLKVHISKTAELITLKYGIQSRGCFRDNISYFCLAVTEIPMCEKFIFFIPIIYTNALAFLSRTTHYRESWCYKKYKQTSYIEPWLSKPQCVSSNGKSVQISELFR